MSQQPFVQLTLEEYERILNYIKELETKTASLQSSSSSSSNNDDDGEDDNNNDDGGGIEKTTTNHDERRKELYERIFFTNDKKCYKKVLIRHQYSMEPRQEGIIYSKETYFQKYNTSESITAIPDPTKLWNQTGCKCDYTNGTIHFPLCLPRGKEHLVSHTIKKMKLNFPNFLYLAAQTAYFQQQEENGVASSFSSVKCDQGLQYLVDILTEKNRCFSKQYTPRNISIHQITEMLHAWIWVYIYDRKEYIDVLFYYLFAGYVVMITNNQGGLHHS